MCQFGYFVLNFNGDYSVPEDRWVLNGRLKSFTDRLGNPHL